MAQGGALQALQRVAKYVKALGRYEVSFALSVGEYSAKGYFRVDGDSYYMNVGTAEVYCDGKVRYEVDHNREEINVDNVDLASRNVLDNPTRCFDFVGSGYESNIHSSNGSQLTIHLRSTDPTIEGDIYLTIDTASARPRKLEYKLYDDVIVVDVLSLEKRKTKLNGFDKTKYKDYELIDFR